jgi:hypothetical protein
MKSGIAPKICQSAWRIMQFCHDKAPEVAGTRCLVNCPIEAQCDYSARKFTWKTAILSAGAAISGQGLEEYGICMTDEERATLASQHPEFQVRDHLYCPVRPGITLSLLCEDNPHGRCVWRCDNDVADHQSVLVQFEDGSTATQ